jgi:hypothetical protein
LGLSLAQMLLLWYNIKRTIDNKRQNNDKHKI